MKKRTNFARFLLVIAFVAGVLVSAAQPANALRGGAGGDRWQKHGEIMPPPRMK